jgi:2-oxoglutarate ferredoxin oxidoreductase subunit beta
MIDNERYWIEDYLRMDRMPHIWCSGCGIGTSLNCFIRALRDSNLPLDKVVVVSGIGCTGRVAGYINLDSFHTTHGRPIPFATGLKLARPELKVVVYSGDGDLIAIGGNHFIHAARRNVSMTVICVNNFNYAMTGGQVGPTTPVGANLTTSPYGNFEHPFNLPYLAASSGAVYVARWTTYNIVQLTRSFKEALLKKGFSFVEVISPCPTLYSRRNKLGSGLDEMKYYKQNIIIKNNASWEELELPFRGKIVVGKFVDIERPTFLETMNKCFKEVFGERYKIYEGVSK